VKLYNLNPDVMPKRLLVQRCTNPGQQVAMKTKFCTIAPNARGPSMWNSPHVTFWRLEFWGCSKVFGKLCTPAVVIRVDLYTRQVLYALKP